MLAAVLFTAAVLALIVVLLLVVVVAGIRQEPTDIKMTSRAPRPTAALAPPRPTCIGAPAWLARVRKDSADEPRHYDAGPD